MKKLFLSLLSLSSYSLAEMSVTKELFNAIEKGDVVHALTMVQHGANMNSFNDDGDMPLHCAIKKELPEVILELLVRGALPGRENKSQQTACDIAHLSQNQFFRKWCVKLLKNPDSVTLVDQCVHLKPVRSNF